MKTGQSRLTLGSRSFLHVFSTEVPSQLPVLSPDFDHAPLFTDTGAVIWIIDSQDEYLTSISQLLRTAIFLAENYPSTNLEVFIHKTDGLSDEYKHETFREVRQRVQDELSDYGYGDRAVSYYQTSIFDHSILEATSKVLHKLLPTFPPTETLLTKLCSTCRIQKCYLFDTVSKIYVATDASPTFLKDYEACSDYIDLVVDIKQLYSWQDESATSSSSNTSESMGESTVTYDPSGDTYIYAREICKCVFSLPHPSRLFFMANKAFWFLLRHESRNLSLVCLMGNEGNSPEQKHLVDHNVNVVHEALVKIFRVSSVWSSLSEREGEDSSGEQESDGG